MTLRRMPWARTRRLTAMRREDYKAIKRLYKAQLVRYMNSVYRRGFEAGVMAAAEQLQAKAKNAQVTEG